MLCECVFEDQKINKLNYDFERFINKRKNQCDIISITLVKLQLLQSYTAVDYLPSGLKNKFIYSPSSLKNFILTNMFLFNFINDIKNKSMIIFRFKID